MNNLNSLIFDILLVVGKSITTMDTHILLLNSGFHAVLYLWLSKLLLVFVNLLIKWWPFFWGPAK